ncbi:hypothetical protein DdX_06969 [Ditylenchus destructor]|uniref:Uncharacterized protein n=1 Tax=Ditylenchus destructor TaxID=166010 RepID=A0AAD4N424_9BILA|nr:hypothetical protein DdX_06969 [Ditylenchus destructor]
MERGENGSLNAGQGNRRMFRGVHIRGVVGGSLRFPSRTFLKSTPFVVLLDVASLYTSSLDDCCVAMNDGGGAAQGSGSDQRSLIGEMHPSLFWELLCHGQLDFAFKPPSNGSLS